MFGDGLVGGGAADGFNETFKNGWIGKLGDCVEGRDNGLMKDGYGTYGNMNG